MSAPADKVLADVESALLALGAVPLGELRRQGHGGLIDAWYDARSLADARAPEPREEDGHEA